MSVFMVDHVAASEQVVMVGTRAAQAVVDDDRQFITKGGVIGNAIGNDRGKNMAVPVLVLQSFSVQSSAAGGCAEEKTPRALVARCPREIADALEAEHRIEDVERHHH